MFIITQLFGLSRAWLLSVFFVMFIIAAHALIALTRARGWQGAAWSKPALRSILRTRISGPFRRCAYIGYEVAQALACVLRTENLMSQGKPSDADLQDFQPIDPGSLKICSSRAATYHTSKYLELRTS